MIRTGEKDQDGVEAAEDKHKPLRARARGRLVSSIAILPALVTVLNGLFGFAAIHYATKDPLGATTFVNLTFSAWLIIAAMIADTLDGRIARMTRRTTDFGGQLDSLCDVVSFGVAPAMLMLRTVTMVIERELAGGWLTSAPVERLVWCVAAVYVACAVLRLARFNVENEPDESAHMRFEGLPAPGAAALMVSLVLLLARLTEGLPEASGWLMPTASMVLPAAMLLGAMLMVSRVDYPHLVNHLIRNRSPWSVLVLLTVCTALGFVVPYPAFAAAMVAYVAFGIIRTLLRRAGGSLREE